MTLAPSRILVIPARGPLRKHSAVRADCPGLSIGIQLPGLGENLDISKILIQ
jgi:hypothetical protein